MSEKKDDTSELTQLGSQRTEYKYTSPCAEMLETFPNQHPDREYTVYHETEEFTSLCPKTGQPDFARVSISFCPDEKCVETKSLKLYLFAYRNEGAFMETICNRVRDDLVEAMEPRWLRVEMAFNARGGIETTVYSEYDRDEEPGIGDEGADTLFG